MEILSVLNTRHFEHESQSHVLIVLASSSFALEENKRKKEKVNPAKHSGILHEKVKLTPRLLIDPILLSTPFRFGQTATTGPMGGGCIGYLAWSNRWLG